MMLFQPLTAYAVEGNTINEMIGSVIGIQPENNDYTALPPQGTVNEGADVQPEQMPVDTYDVSEVYGGPETDAVLGEDNAVSGETTAEDPAMTGEDVTEDDVISDEDQAALKEQGEGFSFRSAWIDDFSYLYTEGTGKITITKYNGRERRVDIHGKALVKGEYCDVYVTKGEENFFPAIVTDVNFGSDGNKVYGEGSLYHFFHLCPLLKNIDFRGLDTTAVTEMSSMFSGCKKLVHLDLTPLVTANVIDAGFMFRNCTALKSIDMGGLQFGSVQNMSGMFSGCESLKVIKMPALINPMLASGFATFPYPFYCNYIEHPAGSNITFMQQGLSFTSTPLFFFVNDIALDNQALMIDRNDSIAMKPTVYPEDATMPDLIWKSDNTSAVTVDQDGNIKAEGAGNANITARAADGSGVTANCMVIVNPTVQTVKIDKTELALGIGQSMQLKAAALPEDSYDRTIRWSVSGSAATVSEDGTVTGVEAGSSVVTASSSDGKCTAKCKVSVSYNPVAISMKLNKTSLELVRGDIYKLEADINPSNADQSVNFSSSDSNVVKVLRSGILTAISEGEATVTAVSKDGRFEESCSVTVSPKKESLSQNHAERMSVFYRDEEVSELTLSVNSFAAFYAKVTPERDSELTDTVYFSSSNENVAYLKNISVDGRTGFFETVSTGNTKIDIICGSLRKTVILNVACPSGELVFEGADNGSISLEPGESLRLNAKPKAGQTTEDIRYALNSDGKRFITLKNGVIKARNKEGSAVITAYTDSLGLENGTKLTVTVKNTKPEYTDTSNKYKVITSKTVNLELRAGKSQRSSRDITVKLSGREFAGAYVSRKVSDENVCEVKCKDPGKSKYTITALNTGTAYITWTAVKNIEGIDHYSYAVTK
ncbi:MAG: Ig-like domain-containing protein, partial [Lachnospiraceae bacterium]|nr:Ig-like domain-containing protein [Lachnospiraceae bacterium]